MGRTHSAKAVARELKHRINLANQKRNELVNYLIKLKKSYSQEKISYSRYIEIFYKSTDGKTITEWIDYYDWYIKDCEKRLRQERKKIIRTNIMIGFFCIGLVIILISSLNLAPRFIGFVIQEPSQEFSDNLNLVFTNSTTYEWEIKNQGVLDYVKLNGLLKGDGEVRVYLDDLLIYENSKTRSLITGETIKETSDISWFKKLLGVITGRVAEDEPVKEVVEEEQPVAEETSEEQEEFPEEIEEPVDEIVEEEPIEEEPINESYSEKLNKTEALPEDLSPSQEELPHEENITTEQNITEVEEEMPENITEVEEEMPENITEVEEENKT